MFLFNTLQRKESRGVPVSNTRMLKADHGSFD